MKYYIVRKVNNDTAEIIEDETGIIETVQLKNLIKQILTNEAILLNCRLEPENTIKQMPEWYETAKRKHIAGELLGSSPEINTYDNMCMVQQGTEHLVINANIKTIIYDIKVKRLTVLGIKGDQLYYFVTHGLDNIVCDEIIFKNNVSIDSQIRAHNIVLLGKTRIRGELNCNTLTIDGELLYLPSNSCNLKKCSEIRFNCNNNFDLYKRYVKLCTELNLRTHKIELNNIEINRLNADEFIKGLINSRENSISLQSLHLVNILEKSNGIRILESDYEYVTNTIIKHLKNVIDAIKSDIVILYNLRDSIIVMGRIMDIFKEYKDIKKKSIDFLNNYIVYKSFHKRELLDTAIKDNW